MKKPYLIVMTFTTLFAVWTFIGYQLQGIDASLPGMIGLVIQIPITIWIRRKLK